MSSAITPMIDFRIRPVAGFRRDDSGATTLTEDSSNYARVYGSGIVQSDDFDTLVAEMEQHAVRGVVQAEYEGSDWNAANRAAAEMLAARPDLFLAGIATADPREPDALLHLRTAHDELGLRGWVFQPGFLQVRADDPRCFPLYSYCQEYGHPVTIHSGINFSRSGPIEYGRPTAVDNVACLFPDLVLVLNHGGWPWVLEALAVLWKHENVFADLGGVAPKYIADGERSGWSPMAHWMNRQVTSQMLLGTDWPMLRYERLRAELPLIGLSDAAADAYVRGNATQLLERCWGISVPSYR
jgi:predicted TIM-barrel fold metal-dependent hydrolase